MDRSNLHDAILSVVATFRPAAGRLLLKPTPVTCEDVNRDGFGSRIRFGKVATVDTFTALCQIAAGGFGTAQWGD